MLGASLVDVLAGNTHTAHDDAYTSLLYHNGRGYLRQGRWKLVNLEGPFAESHFELFDLDTDPGETKNLAASDPARYARLLDLWRSERRRLGILLPEEQ
jgi:arylsulfatase A-like enzyme